jgi:hypothetical protein
MGGCTRRQTTSRLLQDRVHRHEQTERAPERRDAVGAHAREASKRQARGRQRHAVEGSAWRGLTLGPARPRRRRDGACRAKRRVERFGIVGSQQRSAETRRGSLRRASTGQSHPLEALVSDAADKRLGPYLAGDDSGKGDGSGGLGGRLGAGRGRGEGRKLGGCCNHGKRRWNSWLDWCSACCGRCSLCGGRRGRSAGHGCCSTGIVAQSGKVGFLA